MKKYFLDSMGILVLVLVIMVSIDIVSNQIGCSNNIDAAYISLCISAAGLGVILKKYLILFNKTLKKNLCSADRIHS